MIKLNNFSDFRRERTSEMKNVLSEKPIQENFSNEKARASRVLKRNVVINAWTAELNEGLQLFASLRWQSVEHKKVY